MRSPRRHQVLVIPQWQGYVSDDRVERGARSLAAALDDAHAHTLAVRARPQGFVPRQRGTVGELSAIVEHATAALEWLTATEPERLVVVGGDCGSDFGPMAWHAGRSDGELGLLYLDAHADLNTPASSPSARFHGMVLRAALGEGAPEITALAPRPLRPEQVIMAGMRDFDPGEIAFLDASGIRPLPDCALGDGQVLEAVARHPARRWHVHLDLDVIDPVDFPSVNMPTPGGPSFAEITRLLLELVTRHDILSVTVTEHVGDGASAGRVADMLAQLQRAGW